MAEGRALEGYGIREPFLIDLNAQIRLLVALPLLVAAEPLVHCRAAWVVRPFVDRGIIAPDDAPAFSRLADRAERFSTSSMIALVLLALSTTLAGWIWHQDFSLRPGVWYIATDARGKPSLTIGGWWYVFVSLNLFRFVLFVWYYRLTIWYRFLWRVSRMRLELNPLHPDRAAVWVSSPSVSRLSDSGSSRRPRRWPDAWEDESSTME